MKKTVADIPADCQDQARLTSVLSSLLLGGLVLAIALMVAGAVLVLVGGDRTAPHSSSITALPGLLAGLEPAGLLDLGLLILLATPAARVLALTVAFARRREWVFAGASIAVLVILAAGVVLGLGTW
jgi:uncharacterized membrane protein